MFFGSRTITLCIVILFACTLGNAATFTVTKVADTNDGTCDADCSLREAIAAATAAAGDDIIAFSALFNSPQTIVLGGSELVLGANGSTTINGPGANLLTISGNNASRILSTGANVVALIDGIRFTGGTGVGALNTGRGGAIYNVGGTLTISNSVITGNTAANGGGMNNAASTGPAVNGNLTIVNCTFSSNTSSSSGAALQNFSTSTVSIRNSTLSGNTSNGTGIAGALQANGTVTITNSTISGNSAPAGTGGGLYYNGTNLIVTNSTIVNNSSLNGGGGFHRTGTTLTANIRNTIIAGNSGAATSPDAFGDATSQGNNIIGNVLGSTGWVMSDQQGVNPMLGALANNGGPTQTHLPMAGSPAINMGNNCVLTSTCTAANPPANVTTDQRGTARPQGATVDIGSVEVVAAPAFANVSGRVLTSSGNPIKSATVVMTVTSLSDGELGVVTYRARTSTFGYFSFTGIQAGVTYSVTVSAKGQTFTPQNVPVNGDVSNLVLTANAPAFGELEK